MSYSTYLRLALGAFILAFHGVWYAVAHGVMSASLLILCSIGVFVSVCAIAADERWKKLQDRLDH
jgi:hypothetical protein